MAFGGALAAVSERSRGTFMHVRRGSRVPVVRVGLASLAVVAAFLVGLSKTGVPGFAVLMVAIFANVIAVAGLDVVHDSSTFFAENVHDSLDVVVALLGCLLIGEDERCARSRNRKRRLMLILLFNQTY